MLGLLLIVLGGSFTLNFTAAIHIRLYCCLGFIEERTQKPTTDALCAEKKGERTAWKRQEEWSRKKTTILK